MSNLLTTPFVTKQQKESLHRIGLIPLSDYQRQAIIERRKEIVNNLYYFVENEYKFVSVNLVEHYHSLAIHRDFYVNIKKAINNSFDNISNLRYNVIHTDDLFACVEESPKYGTAITPYLYESYLACAFDFVFLNDAQLEYIRVKQKNIDLYYFNDDLKAFVKNEETKGLIAIKLDEYDAMLKALSCVGLMEVIAAKAAQYKKATSNTNVLTAQIATIKLRGIKDGSVFVPIDKEELNKLHINLDTRLNLLNQVGKSVNNLITAQQGYNEAKLVLDYTKTQIDKHQKDYEDAISFLKEIANDYNTDVKNGTPETNEPST